MMIRVVKSLNREVIRVEVITDYLDARKVSMVFWTSLQIQRLWSLPNYLRSDLYFVGFISHISSLIRPDVPAFPQFNREIQRKFIKNT